MTELLNQISQDNLILVCVIMSVIALFLAIAMTIELLSHYRKKTTATHQIEEKNKINIKEDANIKYVEDNEDLEKTEAKLELAKLKEQLANEEKEKKQLLELNLALTNMKKEEKEVETVKEKKESSNLTSETIPEKDTEILNSEQTIETKIANNNNNIVKEDTIENTESSNNPSFDLTNRLSTFENQEEENAIISYDELKKSTSFGYTDEEMERYADEKDAIISIEELEKLYKESGEISEEKIPTFDIKRVEDLPEISDDKKFQSTPFISPVYGIGVSEENLQLEQTANLEKLNEEIKKTNEFLKALKELKKNLQ